jgi:hypothetical protein
MTRLWAILDKYAQGQMPLDPSSQKGSRDEAGEEETAAILDRCGRLAEPESERLKRSSL